MELTSRGHVFLSEKRATPLTDSGVRRTLKKRARQAGIDPELITQSNLKRDAATKLIESGVSYEQLAVLMGHEDESTSKRYTANRPVNVDRRAGDLLEETSH